MRRFQLLIEAEIDEALAARAATEGVSKGALVRRFVREGLGPLRDGKTDPLLSMSGVETVVYSLEKSDITADVRKLVEDQKKDTPGE